MDKLLRLSLNIFVLSLVTSNVLAAGPNMTWLKTQAEEMLANDGKPGPLISQQQPWVIAARSQFARANHTLVYAIDSVGNGATSIVPSSVCGQVKADVQSALEAEHALDRQGFPPMPEYNAFVDLYNSNCGNRFTWNSTLIKTWKETFSK